MAEQLSMLMLSCDAYSDLWDDFFNLKEKYWPDCPYKWFVVTESKEYKREGVSVIKCGKDLDWAGRFRKAVSEIDSYYFGVYLEDYFITESVDSVLISELVDLMEKNNVTYINTSDVFKSIIKLPQKEYYKEHLIIIPQHQKYGISTEAAIWEKNFLLKKLGVEDYSAWKFEIDRCQEALSNDGLGGFNLCDDRMPFHVSIIPVVIQGKIYPAARRFFRKNGYNFNTQRADMSLFNVLKYDVTQRLSKAKFGRKYIKWIAKNVFRIKFFTEG